MSNDIASSLRPAIVMTFLFAILLGLVYPLAMTGIGQTLFPSQANGSLVRDAGGEVIGSTVVGQAFISERYFQTRPSAAGKDGYDGLVSSGSNLGPTARALVDRVKPDIEKRRGEDIRTIPADLVTASGSGLDPDLTPEAALAQVPRIAAARGLPEQTVRGLVERRLEQPLFGFLGEDRVNVLALNRALDGASSAAR